jgi:hypothetical protein
LDLLLQSEHKTVNNDGYLSFLTGQSRQCPQKWQNVHKLHTGRVFVQGSVTLLDNEKINLSRCLINEAQLHADVSVNGD